MRQQRGERRVSARCRLTGGAAVILLAAWCVSFPPAIALADEDVALSESALPIHATMTGDAALADIFFLDRELGWAVGERGVIWHTADGGATWSQQTSSVSCRLNSVFFLDMRRGWAAGGASQPYAGATRGVVLRTEDGGNTWTTVPNLTLPALARVKFFDLQHGIAIGAAASFAPCGIFATQDGGQTWKPLAADAPGGWLAGDFVDRHAGAVAGSAGRFGTVIDREVKHSPLASASLRSMHAMRLVAPASGWLVGDGGLVLTTRDLGHSWQSPSGALPSYLADHFDLYAVAVHGPNVWIAGAPGTRVFHSPDSGATWHAFATGRHAPLRAITFVDDQHGWAAGELGTILATTDGGRYWTEQRAGGTRAALLALFARGGDVPLELLAEQGAGEGYLTAAESLFSRPASEGGSAETSRTREAMILAGATSAGAAWRFPLAQQEASATPPEVIAALNNTTDGQALERLEDHLVRRIRTWRPDVVVTQHAVTNEADPAAALVEQLVLRAVAAASDPSQQIELASQAGLAEWEVKKVYGLLAGGVHGDEIIASSRFSPLLGSTPADWTGPARRLLDVSAALPPDAYELVLLQDRAGDAKSGRGLMAGLALTPGGEARRPRATLPLENVDELRRSAMRRRNLQKLLERTEGNAVWAGQVANLLDGMAPHAGGELLDQLAARYRDAGKLDLAADTYYLLARRYPDHPLADRALVWLAQFYASSEAALQTSGGWGRATASPQDVSTGGSLSLDPSHPGISSDSAPVIGLAQDDRLRRAVQLGEYLETARPALFAEPSLRFPMVAAQRQLGFGNPAKRYFLTLRDLPESDPWRQCADAEQWLADPGSLPPTKQLGACRRTSERPHLDGALDEPFWELADKLRLKQDAESQGDFRLAYDDEFLYLAVHCLKLPNVEHDRDDRPRPRDADLSQYDRVTLRCDIDRDYTTCFELSVDQRGWTYDAFWGNASWNPTWYVAASNDEATWSIEAAIPLAQVAAEPPSAKHVWAVSAIRTVPGIGNASWAGDAGSGDSPAQFGLVIFE